MTRFGLRSILRDALLLNVSGLDNLFSPAHTWLDELLTSTQLTERSRTIELSLVALQRAIDRFTLFNLYDKHNFFLNGLRK
jgi:hypothetical protein